MLKYCLVFLLFIAIGCKKDNETNSYTKSIVGTWQQDYYVSGMDGNTYYQFTFMPITINFNANNTYEKVQSGKILSQGTYQLGKVLSIYSGKYEDAIKFNNSEIWGIMSINNNTLTINNNVHHGDLTSYTKL